MTFSRIRQDLNLHPVATCDRPVGPLIPVDILDGAVLHGSTHFTARALLLNGCPIYPYLIDLVSIDLVVKIVSIKAE